MGRKPSLADYYVNDANEVIQYLELLRGWNKRNLSYDDLQQLNKGFGMQDSEQASDISEDELLAHILGSP